MEYTVSHNIPLLALPLGRILDLASGNAGDEERAAPKVVTQQSVEQVTLVTCHTVVIGSSYLTKSFSSISVGFDMK